MPSAYTEIVFTNQPQGGITAQKLNLLVDDLSTAIAAAGGGGGTGTASGVWGETPSGAINGSNRSYAVANVYIANSLAVFLNGVRQRRTADYSEMSSTSFQFVTAPLSGDSLSVDYMM